MHVRAEVEGRRWNMHAGGGGTCIVTCMRAEVEHACGRRWNTHNMHAGGGGTRMQAEVEMHAGG